LALLQLAEGGRHAAAEIQHQRYRNRRLFRREIGHCLGDFVFKYLKILLFETGDKASPRIRDGHVHQYERAVHRKVLACRIRAGHAGYRPAPRGALGPGALGRKHARKH